MNKRFLHQYFLHISELLLTTKFHCGPDPRSGKTKVQNKMRAASDGIIRKYLPTYSFMILIFCPFCNLPTNEYAVNIPLSIRKGSVYIEAVLVKTDHDLLTPTDISVRLE